MTQDLFYISPDDSPAKRRIMKDGLHLFATRGLSATSIRDIAAATGYSNPALYKHFKSKDALAITLFERSYREMARQVALATSRADGFEMKFSAYISAFAAFYDNCPDAAIFVSDNLPALWPQVAEAFHGQTIMTHTRELLSLGKKEGLVSDDISLPMQLILVTGMLSQTIRQQFLGELVGPISVHCNEVEKILRKGLA
ncbi:TetR/AcrR family transcriptional regulator [Thalassovita aquimarina]|uniref:TetR/AcrR family transcriptional regulator n=1 Tax=Thalassovita aquimarina TaxID=2785917 RepID=A0ABS5HX83_9RHOB|nr:TetR/AcrR family transcriptional regulator [Thalassovita aquimarina]MBR9653586.1 TetR/AcrR family transcriptional regulator [Thalassovita aquimarina]